MIAEVDALYERFEFAKVADLLYHFAWDEVCDWYLELAKLVAGRPDAGGTTRRVLGEVLDALLRLLHPMMPFVTEALWTALTGGESVVIAPWPAADASAQRSRGRGRRRGVQAVVTEVRRFRSDQGVKPSQRVPARLAGADAGDRAARSARCCASTEPGDGFTATATLDHRPAACVVELDLSGAIDVAAERARLSKDLRRGREGAGRQRRQAGQRGVHRQGARGRGGQGPGPAWPRPRPTSPASRPRSPRCRRR